MQESIEKLFPGDRQRFWKRVVMAVDKISEIRLRIGQPVIVVCREGEFFLNGWGEFTKDQTVAHLVTGQELESLLMHLCQDSPYAYEEELRMGFITAAGGHRIGVAGQAVLEKDGTLRTLKHIYYVNIRIAHQLFGIAEEVLPYLYSQGQLKNVLIISPPGCGKTTLLRELVRRISDGNPYGKGVSVGVVDERSELAGSYLGMPQNVLGCRTDVLDACPKTQGMMLLLRSMAPRVLAVDELGNGEEVKALRMACACGSSVIATIHGRNLQDVVYKFPELGDGRIFTCFVVMGKLQGCPKIVQVMEEGGEAIAFSGRNYDSDRLHGTGILVSGAAGRKDEST